MSEISPEEKIDPRFEKDPAQMTRQERRQWFKLNRKRLGLPRWSELRSLQMKGKLK